MDDFIPLSLKPSSVTAQYAFTLKPDSVADAFLRTLWSNMSDIVHWNYKWIILTKAMLTLCSLGKKKKSSSFMGQKKYINNR